MPFRISNAVNHETGDPTGREVADGEFHYDDGLVVKVETPKPKAQAKATTGKHSTILCDDKGCARDTDPDLPRPCPCSCHPQHRTDRSAAPPPPDPFRALRRRGRYEVKYSAAGVPLPPTLNDIWGYLRKK